MVVAASYANTHRIRVEREVRIPKEELRATMSKGLLSLCFILSLSKARWAWTNKWLLGYKVRSLGENGVLKQIPYSTYSYELKALK